VTTPASTRLTAGTAATFARIALGHVSREYPNKLDHVLRDAGDARTPRDLHPVFFGSFDWHSCVHSWWLLATLLRRFPALDECAAIRALFDERMTPALVAGEVAYLAGESRAGFSRPYGWAWLLMLAAELRRHVEDPRWSEALAPLTAAFVDRFHAFLQRATYPVRVGTHFNTAFALRLALEYADESGNEVWLRRGVPGVGAQRRRFPLVRARGGGVHARRTAGSAVRALARPVPATAAVARTRNAVHARVRQRPHRRQDRAPRRPEPEPRLVLALARRGAGPRLAPGDPREPIIREAAELHLGASLPHVAGDYMGEHWLATFALLALG
jgi:hypothetical protein